MLPVVPKVILITHAFPFNCEDAVEPRSALIDQIPISKFIPLWHTPILAVLLELVKVAVRPAHHGLQGVIQATKQYSARHLNAPPDRWSDVDEGDLQLER